MNLRVSYGLRLVGSSRVEAIGEVFNLFNAKNPAASTPSSSARPATPNAGVHAADAFAGDFQQGEQRVGQIGFRFSF